jgi:hypothetical protein
MTTRTTTGNRGRAATPGALIDLEADDAGASVGLEGDDAVGARRRGKDGGATEVADGGTSG